MATTVPPLTMARAVAARRPTRQGSYLSVVLSPARSPARAAATSEDAEVEVPTYGAVIETWLGLGLGLGLGVGAGAGAGTEAELV